MGANGSNGASAKPIIFERPGDDGGRPDFRGLIRELARDMTASMMEAVARATEQQSEFTLTTGKKLLALFAEGAADARAHRARQDELVAQLTERVAKLERAALRPSDSEP